MTTRRPRRIISENRWIHINLKNIKDANGKKVDYINRNGHSANMYEEKKIFQKLNDLDLADANPLVATLNDFGETVCSYGGWLPYKRFLLKQQREQNDKQREIGKLQREISLLTKKNLKLQNKQLQNRIIFAIIGGLITFVLSNLKVILNIAGILD
jgi:hypothetical protein